MAVRSSTDEYVGPMSALGDGVLLRMVPGWRWHGGVTVPMLVLLVLLPQRSRPAARSETPALLLHRGRERRIPCRRCSHGLARCGLPRAPAMLTETSVPPPLERAHGQSPEERGGRCAFFVSLPLRPPSSPPAARSPLPGGPREPRPRTGGTASAHRARRRP
jgi:hypothetical protein